MWVVGLLVVVVLAAVAAVAYRGRRRSVRGTMPAATSRPAGGEGPRWAERAEDLSATKPSQAQATESPAQRNAPRAVDS